MDSRGSSTEPGGGPAVSVIIPTWNEEGVIAETVQRISAEGVDEIIVVDGGSSDRTVDIARQYARVVLSSRGRAHQLNCGAEATSGDVLLFLHADCVPRPGWLAKVRALAARPGFCGGCFRLRIDGSGMLLRVVERSTDLRARLLGVAYGDQAIFLSRSVFERLGGFPNVRLMEDLLMVRALRKLGRLQMLDHAVQVSSRRWEKRGVIRQTLLNWSLVAALWCGVHPDRLARFYPPLR